MNPKVYDFDDTHTLRARRVYDEKELSEAVLDTIHYYKKENEMLQKENDELHRHALELANEELKDEIQSLQEQLALSYGQFASDKEQAAYLDFEDRHMHDRLTSKYNGGRGPYLIPTGTGIGTILHVKCPIFGEEEDITDTEAW